MDSSGTLRPVAASQLYDILFQHHTITEFAAARDYDGNIQVLNRPSPDTTTEVCAEIGAYVAKLKCCPSVPAFIHCSSDIIYFTEKTVRDSELYQMKSAALYKSRSIVAVDWGCFQTEDDIKETLTLIYAYIRHIEMIIIVTPTDNISDVFETFEGTYAKGAAFHMPKPPQDANKLVFQVGPSDIPQDPSSNAKQMDGYTTNVSNQHFEDHGGNANPITSTATISITASSATRSTPFSGGYNTSHDFSFATDSSLSPSNHHTNDYHDQESARFQKVSQPITVALFPANTELAQYEDEIVHWTTVGSAIHDVMKEDDFWKGMSARFDMEQIPGLEHKPRLPSITLCGMLTASVESDGRTAAPYSNRALMRRLRPAPGIVEGLRNPTYEHKDNGDWSFAMHGFEHARGCTM